MITKREPMVSMGVNDGSSRISTPSPSSSCCSSSTVDQLQFAISSPPSTVSFPRSMGNSSGTHNLLDGRDLQHLSPSPGNGSNSSIAGVMSLASMAAATPSPTHSLHAMGMGGSNIFITPPSHHMHSPPEIAGMGGLSPEGIEGVSALSPSSLNMAAVFANSAHHNTPMGGSPGNNSMGVKNHQMCGECGKVFTSSSALAKHKLTHSDERRYSCNLCHKRFKRQDHLNGHKLTHSATKPFVCCEPECGKSYCDQRQLKRHLANQHGKLQVDYAQLRKSKLFSPSNTTLVTIQGVNGNETQMYAIAAAASDENPTIEKESTCPVCHKTFPTLPALNGHMRLHGGYDKETKEQALKERDRDKTSSHKSANKSSTAVSSNGTLLSSTSGSYSGLFDDRDRFGGGSVGEGAVTVSLPLSINSNPTSASPPLPTLCSLNSSNGGLGSNSSSNVSSPAQPLALTVPHKTLSSEVQLPRSQNQSPQLNLQHHLAAFSQPHEKSLTTDVEQSRNVLNQNQVQNPHDLVSSNPLISVLRDAIVSQSISMSSQGNLMPSHHNIPFQNHFIPTPPSSSTHNSFSVMDLMQPYASEALDSLKGTMMTKVEQSTCEADRKPLITNKFFNPAVFASSFEKVVKHRTIPGTAMQSIEHPMESDHTILNVQSPQGVAISEQNYTHITGSLQKSQSSQSMTLASSQNSFSVDSIQQPSINRVDLSKSNHMGLPPQSALKSPFIARSPGPSKSVHFVFPPPTSHALTRNSHSDQNLLREQGYAGNNIQSSSPELKNFRGFPKPTAGIVASSSEMKRDVQSTSRTYERLPPPYSVAADSDDYGNLTATKSGLKGPSALPRHLNTSRMDSVTSRNRSFSVDERALRPKPELDEFLTVCDEYIQSELEKMNRRRMTLGGADSREQGYLKVSTDGSSARMGATGGSQDSTGSNSSSRHESPNISPTEKDVVSRLKSNIVEEAEAVEGCFGEQEDMDDEDDDAFLPPDAVVTSAQLCNIKYPLHMPSSSAMTSSKSQFKRPAPLNIPKSVSNFTRTSQQTSGAGSWRPEYYKHCLSASFAVDNNDNSLFPFANPATSQEQPLTPSHANTGLLTPDRLDELFPDEPVLRRNSVATFPCRLDEEIVHCSKEVPITTFAMQLVGPPNISAESNPTKGSQYSTESGKSSFGGISGGGNLGLVVSVSGRRHSTSEVSPSKLNNNLSPPGVFKVPGSIAPSVMTAQPMSASGSKMGPGSSNRHHSSMAVVMEERFQFQGDRDGLGSCEETPPSNMRRSFKPRPIHIPKHISTGVFRSCLKSPRLSVGGYGSGAALMSGGFGLESAPYTPPPMLTPKRLGPGLFTGNFPNASFENRQLRRSERSGSFSADIANMNEPELEPKINVGASFQAELPPSPSTPGGLDEIEDRAVLLWAPMFDWSVNDIEIDQYLSAANSCCVNGGGGNTELAFHQLAKAGGNVKVAMRSLLQRRQKLHLTDPLSDYHYQNGAYWSTEEKQVFVRCWSSFGKDFYAMAKYLTSKRLSDIVEYYYCWKLISPDYKKMKNSGGDTISHKKMTAVSPASSIHRQSSSASSIGSTGSGKDCELMSNNMDQKQRQRTRVASSGFGGLSRSGSVSESPSWHLGGGLSAEKKRRKLSCQWDSCHSQFDSITALNAHLMSVHGANPSPVTPGLVGSQGHVMSMLSRTHSESDVGEVEAQQQYRRTPPGTLTEGEVVPGTRIVTPENGSPQGSNISHNNRSLVEVKKEQAFGQGSDVGGRGGSYSKSPVTDETVLELSPASNGHFPCEICGKVFSKVKSRNAHMKMHRHQQQHHQPQSSQNLQPHQLNMHPLGHFQAGTGPLGNMLTNSEMHMYNMAAQQNSTGLVDPRTPPPLSLSQQANTGSAFAFPRLNGTHHNSAASAAAMAMHSHLKANNMNSNVSNDTSNQIHRAMQFQGAGGSMGTFHLSNGNGAGSMSSLMNGTGIQMQMNHALEKGSQRGTLFEDSLQLSGQNHVNDNNNYGIRNSVMDLGIRRNSGTACGNSEGTILGSTNQLQLHQMASNLEMSRMAAAAAAVGPANYSVGFNHNYTTVAGQHQQVQPTVAGSSSLAVLSSSPHPHNMPLHDSNQFSHPQIHSSIFHR